MYGYFPGQSSVVVRDVPYIQKSTSHYVQTVRHPILLLGVNKFEHFIELFIYTLFYLIFYYLHFLLL